MPIDIYSWTAGAKMCPLLGYGSIIGTRRLSWGCKGKHNPGSCPHAEDRNIACPLKAEVRALNHTR